MSASTSRIGRANRCALLALALALYALLLPGRSFAQTTVLLGSTSVATGLDTDSPGSGEAFPVTASSSGTLNALSIYLDASSTANTVFIGLYTNSGGAPGQLLTAGSVTAPQKGAWNTVAVSPVSVTSSTGYWIGLLGAGGTIAFRDANQSGCSSFSSTQSNLTALPAVWSAGSRWPTCSLSAYGASTSGSTPSPILSSISPTTTTAGGAAFNLTVTGSNFVSGDLVLWNGSTLSTSFVTAGQLTASVPATLIASPGTASVAVETSNGGTTTSALSFTINAPAAPVLTSISPASATAGGTAFSLTLIGANFVSGDSVLWNGSPLSTSFVSGTQLTAAVPSSLIANVGTATVAVQAPGGGTTGSLSFVINPAPPVLSSISPSSAAAGGTGFTLTVNGANFVSGDLVLWNGSALSTAFVSATQLTASVSASLIANAGTATVVVQGPSGGSTTNALSFSISAPPPTLNSISPTSATAGGTAFTLTVTGANFVSGDVVLWNASVLATTFVSATQLSAAVPASDIATSGTATVAVQTAAGSKTGALTFTINSAPPTLNSISPTGATAGGAGFTITVNGANFVSGDVVVWNASALTTTFVSTTQLTATVPATDIATPGTATVAVQTAAGNDTSSLAFTINAATPTLSSISPASAIAGSAGFTLTATGTNFASGNQVLWNGSALTTTFVSNTQLTAAVPSSLISNSGSASISIQGSGGSTSNSLAFSINAASNVVLVGTQTVEGVPDSNSAGGAEAFQDSGITTGTVSTLMIYVDTSSSAKQLVAGIYSDASGRPGTLLGQGSSSTLTAGAWNAVAISPASVTAGTRYWIAILGTGGTLHFRDGSGCTSVSSSQTNLTALPASWSSGSTWPSCPLSAYGLGAASGGGSPTTFSISGTLTPSAGGSGATVVLSGAASATTTSNSGGAYSFSGLANGSYAITPSNSGYTFNPTSQAVTVNGANVTGINFTAAPQTTTYTVSGTISPAATGSGSLVTLSGAASFTTTANASGNYSFTGLSNGSYVVTPSSGTATFSPTSRAVTVNNGNVSGVNFSATGSSNVLFFDDFTGSSLSSDWTVIQRHGEYAQGETECNTAGAVSVANSVLTITTSVGPATCGDFNIDGSVRHAPQSWPYITGDVQWTSLNFTYGTVEVRAQFPPQATGVWPAIWMLGANCQVTNIYTADTNYSTCPAPGSAGYQEIDTVECHPQGNWCQFIAYNGSVVAETHVCNFSVDTNWHVYTMVWAAGSLSLAMDGQALPGCSASGNAVPTNPMFLLLQTQTAPSSPEGPPNNALLPTTFNIDYVKVTQP